MFTDKKYPIKQKKITFTLKYKNNEKLEKTSFQSSSFTLWTFLLHLSWSLNHLSTQNR